MRVGVPTAEVWKDDVSARPPVLPSPECVLAWGHVGNTEEAADNGGPPPLCVSVRGLRRSRSA